MVVRVQVTDDFLVAVPDEARQRLKIERGDSLLVEVRDNAIILTPEPHDYARQLRGLHREIWEDIDVDEYVRRGARSLGELTEALRRHDLVGFDTSIFIYQVEDSPQYATLSEEALGALADGQFQDHVSSHAHGSCCSTASARPS